MAVALASLVRLRAAIKTRVARRSETIAKVQDRNFVNHAQDSIPKTSC